MTNSWLSYEPLLRMSIFASVLLLMALWEFLSARRQQRIHRWRRWPHNLLIVAIDTLAVRLAFPLAAVGMALIAAERSWGLFNIISAPLWVEFIVAVVVLDVAIYFQHRIFHAVPWLWRLHRMHHADLEFDVTTGLRFHPLEILISMAVKLAVVAALGAPAVAVLVFEILLNAASMFNHSNVNLPLGIDRWLRRFVVTPDMHRVHHSIIRRETDSNFGFSVSWWDRIFRTYRDQPEKGHLDMVIGIDQFRTEGDLWLHKMLIQPFVSSPKNIAESSSVINDKKV